VLNTFIDYYCSILRFGLLYDLENRVCWVFKTTTRRNKDGEKEVNIDPNKNTANDSICTKKNNILHQLIEEEKASRVRCTIALI